MKEPCEKCGNPDVVVILGWIGGLKVALTLCDMCDHESFRESLK